MRDLDISEVARRSGLPASTLRFYEEKGLIASHGRRGLKRLFDPEVLERLSLIALGRLAGFTLDEIGDVLAPGARPRIEKTRLAAKADEIDGLIKRLRVMRDGLRHAADCKAEALMDCPHFRRVLRLGASGRLERARPRSSFRAETL